MAVCVCLSLCLHGRSLGAIRVRGMFHVLGGEDLHRVIAVELPSTELLLHGAVVS